MGFKVHFPEVQFQRVDPKDRMVAVGDPVIVKRGGDVPDWAPPAVVAALVHAGMVIPVADQPVVVDASPMGGGIANPEILPQMGGPATLEQVFSTESEVAAGRVPGESEVVPDDVPGEPVARPSSADNKAAWEAYAASIGIPRTEAESLSKARLQERVAQRETEMESDPNGLASPAV